jgi:beta-N-acetylhexosaminidase
MGASAPPSAAAAPKAAKSSSNAPAAGAAGSMSLQDRVAQLIIVRSYGDYLSSRSPEYRALVHWIKDLHVGGFIVANRVKRGAVINAQPFEMASFINRMQGLAKTPLLVAADFEHGASMRVAGTAKFPYFMAYGAAHDLNAVRQLGEATAREARTLGITWVFAPDADVNNNPDNPIINTRSYGEDPQAVAEGVAAFIAGTRANPEYMVLTTAKHFPGHGDTGEDSHLQLAELDQTRERIEQVELAPFRRAIQDGVDSVMTAHMAVPAFEPEEKPATVSRNVLTGLLRDELKFRGIIVTDALDMQGVTALYGQGDLAVRAIEAGADVLLMPSDPEACIKAVVAAVKSGRISRKRLDESVARVLAAKRRLGIYRRRKVDLDAISDGLDEEKSSSLAQTAADEAITLVKDDRRLFPASDGATSCLVVLTEGQFSTRGQDLIAEVRRLEPKMRIAMANATMPETVLTALGNDLNSCSAVYAAAFVAVAAYRGNVQLAEPLTNFLNAVIHNHPPVALISMGNPYLLSAFPNVAAYAAAFSTVSTSEIAVARAIFGEIAIQGRMPVSIPGYAKIGDGIAVAARTKSTSNPAE